MKNTGTMAIPELSIEEGKVTFRRGTKKDIDAMGPQWFYSDLPSADSDDDNPEIIDASKRYWKALLTDGEKLIVGEIEDTLVGRVFVNLTARQSPRSAIKVDHPTGIIERLKVSIEHRGIGRTLIENAEHTIREAGLSAVEIGVHELNARALNLYLELGYTQLLSNHEERSSAFEGFITFRYQKPTCVLFKYLR